MKLLIMEFSSPSYYFIPLLFKHSPQRPVVQIPSVHVTVRNGRQEFVVTPCNSISKIGRW
jgi:hypothetical protein